MTYSNTQQFSDLALLKFYCYFLDLTNKIWIFLNKMNPNHYYQMVNNFENYFLLWTWEYL